MNFVTTNSYLNFTYNIFSLRKTFYNLNLYLCFMTYKLYCHQIESRCVQNFSSNV